MVNNYYSVLGLKEGASENEIKRAYFRLIRQFSPETDPERFKEIREAYEGLKEQKDVKQLNLPIPADAAGQQTCEQVQNAFRQRNYRMAAQLCEIECRYRKNAGIFLYYLGIAQSKLGNSGKAVKTFERLIDEVNDEPLVWREMALAYFDRGYTKKAYSAFEKAYKLGISDDEFLIIFAMCCERNRKYTTGSDILYVMLSDKRKRSREDIGNLLEAFKGLISMAGESERCSFTRLFKEFIAFLKKYTVYLEAYTEDVLECVYFLTALFTEADDQDMQGLEELWNILEQSLHSKKAYEKIQDFKKAVAVDIFENDLHLSSTAKMIGEAFQMLYSDFEPSLIRFAQIDAKLCVLYEMPEILKEFDTIEAEYPDIFKPMRDFVAQLREGNKLNILKEMLLKDYRRLCRNFDGGIFCKRHPELIDRERVIFDGYSETPYVRGERKIGRNEPCPCGSGKKYKNCCGRK